MDFKAIACMISTCYEVMVSLNGNAKINSFLYVVALLLIALLWLLNKSVVKVAGKSMPVSQVLGASQDKALRQVQNRNILSTHRLLYIGFN